MRVTSSHPASFAFNLWADWSRTALDMQERLIEATRDQWRANNDRAFKDFYRGPMMASALERMGNAKPGHGLLYKEAYNHKFLVESAKGEIVEVTNEQLLSLFPQSDEAHTVGQYPRIIITASHAKAEQLSDITDLTHGIEAMARDSSGAPLKLAQIPADITADQKLEVKPGETLIVFANDTDRNLELNAAELLHRLRELEQIEATGEADRYDHASPGAKRIAKFLLSALVTDPAKIDVNNPEPTANLLAPGEKLQLRPDAARIAQHFMLDGYSKGGNTVSDAMRFLVDELLAKDRDGHDIVETIMEHEYRPITETGMSGVHNVVRNIAVIAKAALEEGLTQRYLDAGVHRLAYNNTEHDQISYHRNYESHSQDEKWDIEGVARAHGHDPVDMMGDREGKRGYALDDPRVLRRHREFMAPHYGKAALAHVTFNNEDHCVTLETAPGTTDDMVEAHRDVILQAMKRAGIERPELLGNNENARMFQLCSSEQLFNDIAPLVELHHAFMDLRDDAPGLLISDAVLLEDIPQRIAQLGGKAVAAELVRQTEKALGYENGKAPGG